MKLMHFVTLWLRKGDEEDAVKGYAKVMEEVVKKHCGGMVGEVRVAKGGRRLTVTTLCKVQECQKPEDTIERMSSEISEKTGRTTKGIGLCGKV